MCRDCEVRGLPYGTLCEPVGDDPNLLTDTETGRELTNMKEAARHRSDGGESNAWQTKLCKALEALPYVKNARWTRLDKSDHIFQFHITMPKVRDQREERVVNFTRAYLEAANRDHSHIGTVDVGDDEVIFNIVDL